MTVLNAVIGLAVLVWVVWNQMRTRPLTARRTRLAGILGIIGVVQLAGVAQGHPVGATAWALLLVGLAAGAAIGVWRAFTMRMWVQDGVTVVRGTWLTAVLWLVSVALHVGIDLLAPSALTTGSASILLFVAVSLGVQALALTRRAVVADLPVAEPQRA